MYVIGIVHLISFFFFLKTNFSLEEGKFLIFSKIGPIFINLKSFYSEKFKLTIFIVLINFMPANMRNS